MNKRAVSILIVFLLFLISIQVNAQDNQKQGSSFSPVWDQGKNANGARKEPVVPQRPLETKDTKGDFKMTTLEIILLITTIICGFFWLHYKGQKEAFEARYYYERLLYAGLSEAEAMEETQRKYKTISKAFQVASEDMKIIFKEALNKGGHKTM